MSWYAKFSVTSFFKGAFSEAQRTEKKEESGFLSYIKNEAASQYSKEKNYFIPPFCKAEIQLSREHRGYSVDPTAERLSQANLRIIIRIRKS